MYKADSQFEKLCRKTVVLLACSELNCSKYDLMAGWEHTESLVSPLRIRLDGTTLYLAFNPHPESLYFPPCRPNSGLDSQKRAGGHLSPEIGDRWRPSRADSHSHWWSIVIPPRAGPTRTSRPNSPLYLFTGGGGGSGNWELHVNQPNSAGILYNYLCILYIISNPSSLYTFNVNLAGF